MVATMLEKIEELTVYLDYRKLTGQRAARATAEEEEKWAKLSRLCRRLLGKVAELANTKNDSSTLHCTLQLKEIKGLLEEAESETRELFQISEEEAKAAADGRRFA